MHLSDIVLVVGLSTAAVVLMRLAPGIRDSITWVLSGEQGCLMYPGFLPKSSRVRQTIELHSVVSRLALITRLNLPLCPALEAAAEGESPRVGGVMRKMSRLIGTGCSVSAAFEAAVRGCPAPLAAVLRMAERCGQLPRALADQQRTLAAAIDMRLTSTPHARHAAAYATFMILLAGTMVLWIMILIMPRFRDIFFDFNTPLPTTTLILIDVAQWCAAYGWVILTAVFAITFGVVLVCARARMRNDAGIIARTVAALRWAFPATRTLDYGLGMARAIRSMALGMQVGAPNTVAPTLPAVVSTTNRLRERLAEFVGRISDGIAPHMAAQEAGLGDVFVSALKMVERGEDPERVLGHAADYYEAIAYRWWRALAAVSGPLVTLALGAMIGFVALALFLPHISLIKSASEAI